MIGGIIIGDEILRGKRDDKHLAKLIELLGARGLKLDWAQYLGDDPVLITATLQRTFASPDVVFCFGGIGATPDDHTRACAAAAAGVDLCLHPDAEAELRARYGAEASAFRLRMGEFPRGAEIIPNPYNRVPGFSLGEHFFVPGFPIMAWPMVEWVLDTHYAHLFNTRSDSEASVIVYDLFESTITPLMADIEARFQGVKTFSLPSIGDDGIRRHIEFGVRGAPALVIHAIEMIKAGVTALGGRWQELNSDQSS